MLMHKEGFQNSPPPPPGADAAATVSSSVRALDDAAAEDVNDEAPESAADVVTRKARKALAGPLIAALKALAVRADIVEAPDVTAPDPALLVSLKSSRGAVGVPQHWTSKRRYLQGNAKRGVIKPPFELPAYIAATGIGALRDLDAVADDRKGLKGKTRERARPKMGRIEVDYMVLHDAFFVHQTKPFLSVLGDLYYEGREFEPDRSHLKAGVLSARLREALNMQGPLAPPPWLLNMQRYGPPPAFRLMSIPGLSAPIPTGAAFGFGPGQWGRPPTDASGVPLYGDVFGVHIDAAAAEAAAATTSVRWGEPLAASLAAPAPSMRDAAEAAEALFVAETPPPPHPAPAVAPAAAAPAAAAAGGRRGANEEALGAAADAVAEPALLELRKGVREAPQVLYTVLEEKTTALTGGLLGTKHGYAAPGAGTVRVVAGTGAGAGAGAGEKGVALALAPDEVAKLTDAELAERYEVEAARASDLNVSARGADDLTDLLAEQEKKTAARKRKAAGADEGSKKRAKGGKDFKF